MLTVISEIGCDMSRLAHGEALRLLADPLSRA